MSCIIYLDFDGTVVEHEYPKIGRNNFGCFEIIKKLQDAKHKIILNTYRADCNDGTLEAALEYINEKYWYFLNDKDVILNPITEFCKNKLHPPEWNLDKFRHDGIIWIDNICKGIPLKPSVFSSHPMVDWDELDKYFRKYRIYEIPPTFLKKPKYKLI